MCGVAVLAGDDADLGRMGSEGGCADDGLDRLTLYQHKSATTSGVTGVGVRNVGYGVVGLGLLGAVML